MDKRPMQIELLWAVAKQFDYDPDRGLLTHRKTGQSVKPNNAGFCYCRFRFGSKSLQMRSSKVAFFKFYGYLPANKVVEHANGDRSDCRIKNLKLVDKAS